MATINTDEFMSTSEAASYLDLAIDSVTTYCNKGILEAVKVGYVWMIPKDAVKEFKKKRKGPGRPKNKP